MSQRLKLDVHRILEPKVQLELRSKGVGLTEIPTTNVQKVRGFSYLGNTKDRSRRRLGCP